MNKSEYGEKIVTEIINAYKLSEDFEKDAIDYVYKTLFYKLNSICAQIGFDFAKINNETYTIEDTNEFIKNMEHNIHLREILDELMLIGFECKTNSKLNK